MVLHVNMTDNKQTNSNMDKLIPEMFDQMRSNLGSHINANGINMKNNEHNHKSSKITTQSLLQELEALDKVILMIDNLDKSLQKALPEHLSRIQETCKSTNLILDTWINIQSQAGYVHSMMDNNNYLKEKSEKLDKGLKDEDLLEEKIEEIEKLKQQLKEEQQKKDMTFSQPSNVSESKFGGRNIRNNGRVSKFNSRVNSSTMRAKAKPTGIPAVSTRLARPTASSSRKMFR